MRITKTKQLTKPTSKLNQAIRKPEFELSRKPEMKVAIRAQLNHKIRSDEMKIFVAGERIVENVSEGQNGCRTRELRASLQHLQQQRQQQ